MVSMYPVPNLPSAEIEGVVIEKGVHAGLIVKENDCWAL
jgi:hypothetical protein